MNFQEKEIDFIEPSKFTYSVNVQNHHIVPNWSLILLQLADIVHEPGILI